MGLHFASGKRARAICDRCGFAVKYTDLRTQFVANHPTGLKVCSECLDEDHPQLDTDRLRVYDPQALDDPRPDHGELAASRELRHPARARALLTQRIKRREPFRPFAASVLREAMADWFEVERDLPWMTMAVPVRAARRAQVPAVVHADGTSRPQTVTAREAPVLHDLIRRFAVRTASATSARPASCLPSTKKGPSPSESKSTESYTPTTCASTRSTL